MCVGKEVAVPLPHRTPCEHPQPLPARAVQNRIPPTQSPGSTGHPAQLCRPGELSPICGCIHPRPPRGWRPDLRRVRVAVVGVCGWLGGCAPVPTAGFICLWGEGAAPRPGTSARSPALLPVPEGRAPGPPGTSPGECRPRVVSGPSRVLPSQARPGQPRRAEPRPAHPRPAPAGRCGGARGCWGGGRAAPRG